MQRYVEETFVKPGIATSDDIVGSSHCMTPAYLQNQLDQSLKNLGVSTVDVYYIHNPESQLGYVSATEFYHRLQLAFERLEQNRSEGKLRYYGVATWNGFRVEPDSLGYHSLERMVETGAEVGGENHGFRFIQLPLNLAMPEAIPVADAADQLGVTVIASASMLQARLSKGIPEQIRVPLGSLHARCANRDSVCAVHTGNHDRARRYEPRRTRRRKPRPRPGRTGKSGKVCATVFMSDERYKSFSEFWPFYVAEHSRPGTRVLHFIGTTIGVALVIYFIATGRWWLFLLGFVPGYGFAWLAHFLVEKNRPATFKYPLWSLMGDYKMIAHMLTGKMGWFR